MRLLLVVTTLVLWCTGAPAAQAHGGTYDMKYVDGANLLLLTFNTHTPVSGLEIEHDLRLYDLLGAPIPYDEVAVELHTRDKGQPTTLRGATLLQEHVAPMLVTNESNLTFAYPVRGAYTLEVEFRAGGRAVSAGRFAVDVGQGTGSPSGFPWVRLALVLLLGVVVGMTLPRGSASHRAVEPSDLGAGPAGPDEPAATERAPVGVGRGLRP